MPLTAVLANHMFSPDEVEILVSAFDDTWATTNNQTVREPVRVAAI